MAQNSVHTLAPMSELDLAQAAALEVLCFSDPWPPSAFQRYLSLAEALALTAKNGATIDGYLIARRYGKLLHIANLAVHPERRRQGIGGALLRTALDHARQRGCVSALLDVRRSNSAAFALYATLGFRPVGIKQRYYRRPIEDAVVMRRPLEPDKPLP
jgi:ribosomal-protein-alanine N-acetyltransferase